MTGIPRLGPLRLPQLTAPSNPSSGQNLLYPKSDGKWYTKDSAGTEVAIVDATSAQTLTNKTIALGSNTLSGTTAQFNTALTDNDFATLAGVETLSNKLAAGFKNASGGDCLELAGGASDVIDVKVTGALNGGTPSIGVGTSSDTNVHFNITSKGTGVVQSNGVEALTADHLVATTFVVRVATTANITQSGTQTIDGVAVVVGDRVLCKNQTTTSQNGIWIVAAGAWTRATDAETSAEIARGLCLVKSGSTNANKVYRTTFRSGDTLGTTAMTWTAITLTEAQHYDFPGDVKMQSSDIVPTGWLPMDGTAPANSRNLYPNLFALIGTLYGGGDGVNSFNLPNMIDNFSMGSGGVAGVGVGGGTTTVPVPQHNHLAGTLGTNTTGSTHTHSVDVGNATPGTVNDTLQRGSVATAVSAVLNAFDSQTAGITGAHTHGVTGSTENAGSPSVQMRQPYLALKFLIKAH